MLFKLTANIVKWKIVHRLPIDIFNGEEDLSKLRKEGKKINPLNICHNGYYYDAISTKVVWFIATFGSGKRYWAFRNYECQYSW